ncbi:MAG: endopeptidase La, partial [Candidatus Latescibacterota bacterium]
MTGPAKIPIPGELPLLAVPDAVLFPHERLTLELTGEPEKRLVDEALSGDRFLALFRAAASGEAMPRRGTAARIEQMRRGEDGAVRLTLLGVARVDAGPIVRAEPYPVIAASPAPAPSGHDLRIEALRRACHASFGELVLGGPDSEQVEIASRLRTAGHFADFVASRLRLAPDQRRALLETEDVELRLEQLGRFLDREKTIRDLQVRIEERVKTTLGEKERQSFLRQQIETIRGELGEADERETQIREMDRRLTETVLPPTVRQACCEEIVRLSRIPVQSAEFTIGRTHLDWVLELPWTSASADAIDLARARAILDRNHHGLGKIKERVLEFLAVRKLKRDSPPPLLCFVGPPGVGKTSLGLSIAEALRRKTAHLSLGAITDESEIRGHRRTYSGALPGKILQEIRRVGVRNPLFMIDEIDKIGSDFRGDPAASLLEVLDPEENRRFADHYVNLPFDLSEVFFITTANSTDSIPAGLLDRLEIIEFPGYTPEEKVRIAEKHLLPKQLRLHGLTPASLVVRRRAVRRVIDEYAIEAGLRALARPLAAICRKRASALLGGDRGRTAVDEADLPHYLGTSRHYPEIRGRRPEVGVATALAWTPSGGQILFVEATLMPGRQNLQITGHLGEVMRESAEAALSFVRSFLDKKGAPRELLEGHDIHIHVPAGAIAKDGPSAGVAIATALYSIISGYPVLHNVALTGEITLRGHVLPVGGVKQKILGAHRAGIRNVILPLRNLPELDEIPSEVRRRIQVIPVDRVEEIFA